jgi:hypothetical protein
MSASRDSRTLQLLETVQGGGFSAFHVSTRCATWVRWFLHGAGLWMCSLYSANYEQRLCIVSRCLSCASQLNVAMCAYVGFLSAQVHTTSLSGTAKLASRCGPPGDCEKWCR